MSSENQWLEDVFPITKQSLLGGHSLVFRGVSTFEAAKMLMTDH